MAVFKTYPLPSPTTIYVISFLHISPSVWLRVEEKVILLEKLSKLTSMFLVPYEAQCKKTLRCLVDRLHAPISLGKLSDFLLRQSEIHLTGGFYLKKKSHRAREQNTASGTEICERQDSPGLSAGLNPLKLVNAVPSHCSLLPPHRHQEGLIQRTLRGCLLESQEQKHLWC